MQAQQQTTPPIQQQTILSTFDIFALSEFTGVIDYVRFHNAQNSYSILKVLIPGQKDEYGEKLFVSAVGSMASPRTDTECIFHGKWVDDKKWGKQFKFSNYEVLLPSDDQGIVSYLADICFGVGKAKAKKIVDELKTRYPDRNVLEVIQENPAVLKESGILGKVINPAQLDEIINNLMQNTVLAELSSLICGKGVSPGLAARIYQEYGPSAVDEVKNNPYLLADTVYGIGFKKADSIAMRIGVPQDSEYRIKAAIAYIIKEAQSSGHCFLEPKHIVYGLREGKQLVVTGLGDLLGFLPSIPLIAAANEKLIEESQCVRQGDAIYDLKMYEAEQGVAAHMLRLLAQKVTPLNEDVSLNEVALDELVGNTEEILRKQQPYFNEYAPEQRDAVKSILMSGISIVTGPPGTGKTTVLNGVIKAYKKIYPYRPIYLCAPTGRAAKRMTEMTGLEAKTIHRLLKYNPEFGGFTVNQDNQLSGPGLLICDESSMADIELANSLLQAIGDGIQAVLVGDVAQLPSVNAGSVLRDSIESGVIPTVRLRYNYRQVAGSGIADYAYMIDQRGQWQPPFSNDIEWVRISSEVIPKLGSEQAADEVVKRVKQAVADGLGIMEFQVLSPQHKGAAGVGNLNDMIRDAINPKSGNKPELTFGKTVFRLSDKVLVGKNDYSLGVFNGDLGIVTAVVGSDFTDKDKDGNAIKGPGLFVSFDGEEVFFDYEHLGILGLAYATSIHKSQGSEFKLAIVVCVKSHHMSLAKNLIYTAVTRARNDLVIVAQDSALKHAVENDKIADRFSLLQQRLRKEI